jgi:hypothetical protein
MSQAAGAPVDIADGASLADDAQPNPFESQPQRCWSLDDFVVDLDKPLRGLREKFFKMYLAREKESQFAVTLKVVDKGRLK